MMKKGKLLNNKKYYTFMFIPNSSGTIKTLQFSVWVCNAIAVMLSIICITAIAFCFNDALGLDLFLYGKNKQLNTEIANRDAKISSLLEQINTQNAEINYINRNLSQIEELASSVSSFSSSASRGITASRSSNQFIQLPNVNVQSELSASIEELKQKSDLLKQVFCDISGCVSDIDDYIVSKPSMWPTNFKQVTSTFGYRQDPINPRITQFHSGIDIANNYGAPIYAAGKGTVTFAGYKQGYGYTIIINHNYDIKSLYAHASKLLVKEGQKVSQGDMIAKIGSSGKSTGFHLHFEVFVKEKSVNPYNFLKDN